MSKINTNKWKNFKIYEIFETMKKGDIFQVPTGASVLSRDLCEGDVPRITVSNFDNGISGYYSVAKENANYRVYQNFISVGFLGTVFYQENKASLDMKVHCLKLININLNRYLGEFLVTIIRKSLQQISYSDQISSTVLPYIEIKLPIDNEGEPDYKYMEECIKEKYEKIKDSLIKLKEINLLNRKTKLDVVKWGNFHIYDIFKIDAGTKLDKVKMDTTEPEICFVGRSNVNNGVTEYVKKIDNLNPYPKGCLTLALGGAYLGSCFVQMDQFYTSQNVVVLTSLESISFETKQFIATAIFKESQNNYRAFVDELNPHIKTDFEFKLPITADNKPDYKFMEQYIKKIYTEVKEKISEFKKFETKQC